MPISKGFNHVATLTTDCDRHAEWWGKVFGATVTFQMEKRDDHPRMFILDVGGGAALNVFEVTQDEIIGEQRRQGGRGAIDHFAIAVDTRDELEAVKQRLIDAGGIDDLWYSSPESCSRSPGPTVVTKSAQRMAPLPR